METVFFGFFPPLVYMFLPPWPPVQLSSEKSLFGPSLSLSKFLFLKDWSSFGALHGPAFSPLWSPFGLHSPWPTGLNISSASKASWEDAVAGLMLSGVSLPSETRACCRLEDQFWYASLSFPLWIMWPMDQVPRYDHASLVGCAEDLNSSFLPCFEAPFFFWLIQQPCQPEYDLDLFRYHQAPFSLNWLRDPSPHFFPLLKALLPFTSPSRCFLSTLTGPPLLSLFLLLPFFFQLALFSLCWAKHIVFFPSTLYEKIQRAVDCLSAEPPLLFPSALGGLLPSSSSSFLSWFETNYFLPVPRTF